MRKEFVRHPENEVDFFRGVEYVGVFEERVRILLDVLLRVRYFLHADRQAVFHSLRASLHHNLDSMPMRFAFLR